MKTLPFTKMVGAGNDFILIDRLPKNADIKKLVIRACDRSDGLGADGLMILDKSKKADFKMRIINADGSEAEMCGNGARCMAAYIVNNKKTGKKKFTMETLAGVITAQANGETACVTLSEPRDYKKEVAIKLNDRALTLSTIDTGVPHAVIYVQGLKDIDVSGIGPGIRYHEAFKPRGTNVNFVEILGKELIDCRTYERGVEDETRACGTGSVASAIISYLKLNPKVTSRKNATMHVKTKSGEVLNVTFDINGSRYYNVRLKGSAKLIAKGEYYA